MKPTDLNGEVARFTLVIGEHIRCRLIFRLHWKQLFILRLVELLKAEP